jgi:phage-related minor tail protein
MTTPTSGTDISALRISVGSSETVSASQNLDKLGASTVKVIANLDDLADASAKESAATAKSNVTKEEAAAATKRQTAAIKELEAAQAQALKVQQGFEDAGQGLKIKLEKLVEVFGLTREEVFRLKAEELNMTNAAEPLIAQLEALKAATAQYGVVIHDVAGIEAARISFEESALTAFNAFKIRTMAENRAAAIADINAMDAERISAIEREEARITIFNAFKIRTMTENRQAAMALLTEQEEQAASLAEKQAIAEINWNAKSVQARIAELERLKLYQANSAISSATVGGTFSSAAINDLPNLTRYQKEYADALEATHTGHKKVAASGELLNGVFGTARSKTELLVLAHEALQGRYTRMPGSLMVLMEYTNGASVAITGMGLSTLAVVAAIAAFTYETIKGIEQTKAFNDALNRTNNFAGQTTSALTGLAQATGAVHGNFKEAYQATAELAASGKFTADEIGGVTSAVVNLNHAFGTPLATSIKEFESLAVHGSGVGVSSTMEVTKALEKLDQQYHFVNLATMEQVIALEKEGKQREASALGIKTYTEEGQRAADDAEKYMGSIEKGWNKIARAINEAKQAMANIGKDDPALEMESLKGQIKALMEKDAKFKPGTFGADAHMQEIADLENEYRSWQAIDNEQKKVAADHAADVAKQSAADKAVADIAIEDIRLKRKSQDELTNATQKYMQQLSDIAAKNPNDPALNQDTVNERYRLILKGHTATVAAIKNDGRKQDLLDETDYQSAQYKLVTDAYSADEKYIDDAMKHGLMTANDGYAQLKAGRNDELKALTETTLAKRAVLDDYNARGAVDAAQLRKRQDQLTESYFLSFQKIMEDATKLNGQQADAAKKAQDAIDKASAKELDSLQKVIAKQKEHNAEIGKSKDQIEIARQAQEDAGTADLQIQADAFDAALKNVEFSDTLIGKDRELYEAREAHLREVIKLRKQDAELFAAGADLEAQATIQKAMDSSWKATNKKIGDDLASAIVDGGGNGVKKLIHDMELAFAKAVLRPIFEPISNGISSLLNPDASQANAAGAGSAGGAVGVAQAASNLYSVMSKGFDSIGTSVANGVQSGINLAQGQSYSPFVSTTGTTATMAGQFAQYGAGLYAGKTLGSAISGDYQIDNHGSAINNIATITGAIVGGPIGGAIGGAIGGLINRLFGTGQPTVTHQGLDGYVSNGGSSIEGTVTTNTKGGLLRSDSTDTTYTRSADILNTFNSSLVQIETASSGLAKTLGISADALTNYGKTFDLTLTNDAAANQKVITDFFVSIGDDMAKKLIPNIADFAKVGEIASATLQRLSDTFAATNTIANLLGRSVADTFGSVGIESDTVRERLVNLAGGLTQLNTETSSYVSNYLTESQKLAPVQKAVTDALAAMGLQGLTTKAQFQSVVNGLNLTTQAGAEEFQNLMALQQAYGQVADAQSKLTNSSLAMQLTIAQADGNVTWAANIVAAQRGIELAGLDASLLPLQKRINAIADEKVKTEATTAALAKYASAASTYATDLAAVGTAQTAIANNLRTLGDAVQAFANTADAAKATLKASQDAISSAYFTAQDSVVTAQQKLVSVAQQAAAATKVLSVNIETFLNSLKTTTLGSGSPETQYQALQAQFDKDAQAKDITAALADANNLLTASKSYNASGAGFVADEAHVKSTLSSMKSQADANANAVAPIIDPMVQAQQDLLAAQAKLSDITIAVAKSGASTDRSTQQIAGSSASLLKAFYTAQAANTSAQADYQQTLVLTQGLGLTVSNTLTGFTASIDTYNKSITDLNSATANLAAAAQALNSSRNAANLAGAVVPPMPAGTAPAFGGATTPSNANGIESLYENILGRTGDTGGLAYWTARQTAGVSMSTIASDFYASPEYASLHPIDGSHANGLDYVPFDNYKANLHKGEKVQSVAEIAANAAAAKEMNALLKSIADKLDATIMQNGAIGTQQGQQLAALASKLDTNNRKLGNIK